MAPKEERSFYLYSTGYSPKLLTLGTLIYGNYGMPETRRVTFPISTQKYDELVENEEIISQEMSGCFTYNKSRKYGMGINLAEIASLDFEYAKSCQKLVQAKSGQRVILKSPDDFFGKVLSKPEILDKLSTWITVAKSAWLFYRATFQKPKIYCCTGFYKLSGVHARIQDEGSVSEGFSVSPEAIAIASGGMPIGGTIGPFANGKSLESRISQPEAGIWAARYHQLKVEYLQLATQETAHPAPSIAPHQNVKLKKDCTHPDGGLMADKAVVEETKVVREQKEIERATGFKTSLVDTEEILDDDEPNVGYWQVFQEAENMLEGVFDAASDSEEASWSAGSTDEEQ